MAIPQLFYEVLLPGFVQDGTQHSYVDPIMLRESRDYIYTGRLA